MAVSDDFKGSSRSATIRQFCWIPLTLGHIWGHFYHYKNGLPQNMNTERETTPGRKLNDARLKTLTQPGKYADGDVPGLYLEVKKPQKCRSHLGPFMRGRSYWSNDARRRSNRLAFWIYSS